MHTIHCRILTMLTIPRDLKNVASFLNVWVAGRQNFAANEVMDCSETETMTVFISARFPA